MNKRLIFTNILVLFASILYGQTYILNEDFSSASGSTPPGQWTSLSLTTVSGDVWKFDNPGAIALNFPIIGQFAIFDSQHYSDNLLADESILESPSFDASIGSNVFLFFDHYFTGSSGDTGFVELYDGAAWQTLIYYTSSMTTPQSEVFNVSAMIGLNPNSKVRFRWKGNGNHFWAVDNVSVFIPAVLDAGMLEITNPVLPFASGIQPVKISLKNYGATTLTGLSVNWTVDGVLQLPATWSGSVLFGDTLQNLDLGNYNFLPGQIQEVKVWFNTVNGVSDANHLNDTITLDLGAALCGTYTLGGASPDFANFSEAEFALNYAGISCPVVFLIRDGNYDEQLDLNLISGSSAINTITFRGENLDSASVSLAYSASNSILNYTVNLNKTSWIRFEHMSIFRSNNGVALVSRELTDLQIRNCRIGSNWGPAAQILNGTQQILIDSTHFTGGSSGIEVSGSTDPAYQTLDITISHCIFETVYYHSCTFNRVNEIIVSNNQFLGNHYAHTVNTEYCNQVAVQLNSIQNTDGGMRIYQCDSVLFMQNTVNQFDGSGLTAEQYSSHVVISHNQFLHGTNAHGIYFSRTTNSAIFNNYVHLEGMAECYGISMNDNSDSIRVYFNSVNLENTHVLSSSMAVFNSTNPDIRNNIFSNEKYGTSLRTDMLSGFIHLNYNDYYTQSGNLIQGGGSTFINLPSWNLITGLDANSKNYNPFFTSSTDLTCNHGSLNNTAQLIPGIVNDILLTPRLITPDIGAKEFLTCSPDAGINVINNLSNPLTSGSYPINVELQNHGSVNLTSCQINWSVNGVTQTPFNWTGTLAPYANIDVTIGNFIFPSGTLFTISSWTSLPNGSADCKNANDTSYLFDLGTPLCGIYTIGGSSPDFLNFSQAATALNNAGINCAVLFLVRDGNYSEQFELGLIAGSSAINTITFRGENLDSSLVTLDYPIYNTIQNYTIQLAQTSWIRFEHLSLFRSANGPCIMAQQVEDLKIQHCRVSSNWSTAINISTGSKNILLDANRFVDASNFIILDGTSVLEDQTHSVIISNSIFVHSRYASINAIQTHAISLINNQLLGTDYSHGINFERSRNIQITDNIMQSSPGILRIYQCDTVEIARNLLQQFSSYGIQAEQFCTQLIIYRNKILNAENAHGIYFSHTSASRIFNNFIQLSGLGAYSGIYLNENSDFNQILFNSINVLNEHEDASALSSFSSSLLDVRNNIFANDGNGYSLRTDQSIGFVLLDYNDYYSRNGKIVFNSGTDVTSLGTWTTLTGLDVHSMNYPPFFSSDTDLTANHSLINNHAQAIPGINTDIDGTNRLTPPDIGAREFSICTPDVGINEMVNLSNPVSTGLHDITVEVQNHSNTNLTACLIEWSVNGVTQLPFNWTGTIIPYGNLNVTIGSFTFLPGVIYNLQFLAKNPNNLTDCNPYNDTAYMYHLVTPLCGVYTIGGVSPDFNNFTEAALALNGAGISCPVTFLVRDSIYNEQIRLNLISGSDSINTVTFRGENLDSSLAVLNYSNGNGILDYAFYLNQTSWIRFEHLGILRSNTGVAMRMSNSKDVEIRNCQMGVNWGTVLDIGAGSNDILIDSTRFLGGAYGIDINGSQDFLMLVYDIEISNCYFQPIQYRNLTIRRGHDIRFLDNNLNENNHYNTVYCESSHDIEFSENSMTNVFGGIECNNSSQILIENNVINHFLTTAIVIHNNSSQVNVESNMVLNGYNAHGIHLSKTSSSIVSNNFIHCTGLAEIYGLISNDNSTDNKLVFNSVNLESTNQLSSSLFLEGGLTSIVKNNILCNTGGGYTLRVNNATTITESDFNNFYGVGSHLVKTASQNLSNLSAWQQYNNSDANSFDYNPYFNTPDTLRPWQRELNGAGVPFPGIVFDIDGEIRDENSPDIGADEFMVDFGIISLLEPTLNCHLTVNDTIVVKLKQFGDIPFQDIILAYQVNGGTIFTDTILGSVDNDLVFTFDQTQNLASFGTYIFKIWIVNSYDDNINNDTLIAIRHSHPLPDITASYLSDCANVPIQFNASATVTPGFISEYEWHFGDGHTTNDQNPAHTYDTSGLYQVHLYAFTDVGCYQDTVFNADVLMTPYTEFTGSDICLGDEISFTNSTTIATGTLSYAWDFGDGTGSTSESPLHTYLQAGTYPVSLISYAANGCSDTLFHAYDVYSLPVISFLNVPVNICQNESPILFTTSPSGGYLSGDGIIGNTFYPSIAGIGNANFSFFYTDNHGCQNTITASSLVLSAPAISLLSSDHVNCFGDNDGELEVNISGGTYPAVSLLWNTGSSTNSISGLTAGNYALTVTDLNNCVDSMSFEISQPQFPLSFSLIVTDLLCNSVNTGELEALPYGGTEPYSYPVWSDGGSGFTHTALAAGIYSATLTDAMGCTSVQTDTIDEPVAMLAVFNTTNVVCPGESTGSILASCLGGTPPYQSFHWSDGQAGAAISGLEAGVYTVTITDASNCTKVSSIEVTSSPDWEVQGNIGSILCFGNQTGSIHLVISGGNQPYANYAWSNGMNGPTINSIGAGTYEVTITDSQSCTTVSSFTQNQPELMQLSHQQENILCNGGNNGTISLSVSGGTTPYGTIIWSNSMQGANIGSLTAGVYAVTVFDANACTQTSSTVLTQPEAISTALNAIHVNCFGDETGELSTTIYGGTPPYSYSWNTGETQSSLSQLAAGSYQLTVQDANLCTKDLSYTILSNPDIKANPVITLPTCIFAQDGSITLYPTGGAGDLEILWYNGSTHEILPNLAPGSYALSIEDSLACLKEFILDIIQPQNPCIDPPPIFSPNNDGVNDFWIVDGLDFTPDCSVKILDRWGRTVFESIGYAVPWDGTYKGKPVPSDAYFYIIDFGISYPSKTGKITIIH
ncbi:MAG: gliding motility-associated C-terminal domain-containing protein [Bacteroidales bacterium]|nr:gliding motility-associated C-terminal domain-containing protein [Bacteroidales bacterium]